MAIKKEPVSELSHGKFNELIKKEKGLVVIDFFAEWCMPCVMISPIIESLAESNKNVVFAKINVDDNSSLAQEYQVSSIPCIVFLKQGKEIERATSDNSEEALQEKIDRLA